jgi:hypothetical protein
MKMCRRRANARRDRRRAGRDSDHRFPTANQIAERAHELFVSGGRRVSKIPEYWRTAEADLLNRDVTAVQT